MKEIEEKTFIILLGDFNSRSNTWGKNIQQQNGMGQLLEDIINTHKLYITIGLKNVQVKAKEFKLFKSGHLAIEVLIEDTQNNLKLQPKLKTKNANWDNC